MENNTLLFNKLQQSFQHNASIRSWLFEYRFARKNLPNFIELAAKMYACANRLSEKSPCGKCESCQIDLYDNPDIYFIDKSTEKSLIIKIADIHAMQDFILLQPTISRRRVVIIYNIENMNSYACNAILKTIEESNTIFLCTTARKVNIPKTLLSRLCLFPLYDEISDATAQFNTQQNLDGALSEMQETILDYIQDRHHFSKVFYKINSHHIPNDTLWHIVYTLIYDIYMYRNYQALPLNQHLTNRIKDTSTDCSMRQLESTLYALSAIRENLDLNISIHTALIFTKSLENMHETTTS